MSNYSASNNTNTNSNSRLRRVTSHSHTRVPINTHPRTNSESQKETIINYFKHKLVNEKNLQKITLICFDKTDVSSQLILNFAAEPATVFYKCRLTIINSYLKTNELFHTISPFGNVPDLLYTLVFSILKQNTPIKTKRHIGILIEKSSNTYLTNTEVQELSNSVDILIDRTESGTNSNNECPICLTKFDKIERITLKCHHRICRDCLFNSIENKLYSCPMCRKPIFPVGNLGDDIEGEEIVNMPV